MIHVGVQLQHFLAFFLRVLLILEYANMWVQFKGGNKTRAGTTVQRETLAMFLIWRFGEFGKGCQIKPRQYKLITACAPMVLRIHRQI